MTKIENDPSKGLNAAVAATLNGERAAVKMTFDQLAIETGISKRTLLRLLSTTERHIDVQALETIAAALELNVQDVVDAAVARLGRTSLRDNLSTVRRALKRPGLDHRQA